MDPTLTPFLSPIATIIAAALAGWLGVRYGVAKLRGERAFDRRLEWHENTVRDLTLYASALHAAKAAEREGATKEECERYWMEAGALTPQLVVRAAQAQLYASPATVQRMREMSAEHLSLSNALVPNDPTAPQQGYALTVSRLDTHLAHVHSVSTALANEVRAQLGLKRIAQSSAT
jgi:hypothetical protein